MTGSQPGRAGRRIDRVDLSWAGHWSCVAITPLRIGDIETVREALLIFLRADPRAPLASRVDVRHRRWRPVPDADLAAHVAELVRAAPDPAAEAVPDHVNRHRPPDDLDLPFVAVVGPRSLTVFLNHVFGDAVTFAALVHAFVELDFAALDRLGPRFRLRDGVRALARADRTLVYAWWGEGLASLRRSVTARWRRRRPATLRTGPQTSAALPFEATAVGVVVDGDAVRGLLHWRNAHAPGTSLTALLASRVHTALRAQGVPLQQDGFYTLFDARHQLQADGLTVPDAGNLAKSLFLTTPMTPPALVDTAIRGVVRSRRTLPAIVAGALATMTPRPRGRAGSAGGPGRRPVPSQSFVLTFNSMPALPWIDTVPWCAEGRRRMFVVGLASQPGGVSVYVTRSRARMEITASFDRLTVDERAVLAALSQVIPQPESSPRRAPSVRPV